MDFKNFINNQPVVSKLLKNSFDQNRLFHLYLFVGPRGSLKMDGAIYFASLVLCENNNACGECLECRLASTFQNPHMFVITPDGESIKKEQIEDLEHEFGYKSEHSRVFIIQGIEKATLTAANTLLKFLEELPDNCYGILISENISRVLPTIKSRSQIVTFSPISSEVVFKELLNKGIEQEKASVVSKLTNNVSLGIRYCKDKDIDKIIDLTKNFSECIENKQSLYLEYIKNGKKLLELDREKNKMFFDLLITIQNDKVNYLINRRNNIIFASLEYTNINQRKEVEMDIMEVLLLHRECLDSNANIDMQYSEVFIKIDRILEI